ncbi:MAG: hypothetical protein JXA11_00910 [Phycisphaerae bacterium]|nr:hypothetical protein [Phycisphaerae bacterium]
MSKSNTAFVVTSPRISLELSLLGEITAVVLGERKIRRNLTGLTCLAAEEGTRNVTSRVLSNGGVEFQRILTVENHECELTERFTPTETSIRWEIEIQGLAAPWSTAVCTRLTWPDANNAKFWTTWGDRRYSRAFPDKQSADLSWDDPLQAEPFREYELTYGGHCYTAGGFAIPIATVMEESRDLGFSLVLSPEDTLLGMRLFVDESGRIEFSRHHHRISREHPVRFTMDLTTHEADWRPGLAWTVERYPQFFQPVNPKTYDIAGCGAYSTYEGPLEAEKLKSMGFHVNWKASFDFPYMGMFLPPTQSDDEEWKSFQGRFTSISHLREYSRKMKEMGFDVFNYFNTTEFGTEIQFPPADDVLQPDADSDPNLWNDPNAFLYNRLADAILYGTNDHMFVSWRHCAVLDPGEPVYQEYLLAQARRHIEKFPDSRGIAIDRLDWLLKFNRRRDDGVSWVSRDTNDPAVHEHAIGEDVELADSPVRDGHPARSVMLGWLALMRKLGPLMHDAGKVIYCNPHTKRPEMMEHIDGIFDEMGHYGFNLNLSSFLGLYKPVICWADENKDILQSPEAFFQRHLYMGAFPMAPFPGNDHSVRPGEEVERYFLDYGPMLNALRGRKWILQPHVIEVKDNLAKANVFTVPDGLIIPVMFGGECDRVEILLWNFRNVFPSQECNFDVILPGEDTWVSLDGRQTEEGILLDVPLRKGCAMVRCFN